MNQAANPYEGALNQCYDDLVVSIDQRWPGYDGKVLFVYDLTQNNDWLTMLNRIHRQRMARDSRFQTLAFGDDKQPEHYGLQAADLYCYATRQYAERAMARNREDPPPPLRLTDLMLMRNAFPMLRKLDQRAWEHLIKDVRKDKKAKEAMWRAQGQKGPYFPLIHHPRLREIHEKREKESVK
jgi:hypothetical protein